MLPILLAHFRDLLDALGHFFVEFEFGWSNPFFLKSVNFMQTRMLKMNLQAEKLQLIEWLARLQDADIVKRLLKVKRDSEVAAYEASLKPMTVEELIARAKESDKAIEEGRVYDIEDILREEGGQA